MDHIRFFSLLSAFIFFSIIKLSLAADTINPATSIYYGDTLVSPSQIFELGFFSPKKNKSYLGMWYKKSPETVVWVANRRKPFMDPNVVLTISNYGSLLLLDQTKSIIWSSNTSRKVENPVAQLLDTGNLVLRDNFSSISSESYLWQSFDYPSDTLLPGMKLGWDLKTGRERYLSSWKSADDPYPGDFTYRLDISEVLPQITLYNRSMKMARLGPWNGINFGGGPTYANMLFEQVMVRNSDEIYFMYQSFNNPLIMLLNLNHSGTALPLIWKESTTGWDVAYSGQNDLCGFYGKCGANSVCMSTDKTSICECLKGFIQQNQTSSETCIRGSPLDCKDGDRFMKLDGIKLPDLLDVSLDETITLKECEAKCSKKCSCRAYANYNSSGRGCLMWSGDLIDITKQLEQNKGQDIYIRVSASALESDFQEKKRRKRLKTILMGSIISGTFILGLVFCITWKKILKSGQESKKEDAEVPLFDLSTIATATNNFSRENFIGAGGFGPVYKGNLPSGEEIAVKRLSKNSRQGAEEFRNEIILIAKLQHRNLVGLLGSCIQGEERMLVYEYMPNKSLDCFIFDQKRTALLTWQKRFDIVMGIARGLLYLHQDSKLHIIHRDLKASNILLDDDLNPKISDFGLARIFLGGDEETKTKRVVGTYGYMSPEYTIDGTFSMKSDVFSFGVLLLEIVSGKKNRGFSHPAHHHNLLGHAWLLWNDGAALELMDSCLRDSCVKSEVLRCVQVGLLCVQKFPEDRPAMSSVVVMLENMGATLPQPRQPGFFTERSSLNMDETSREEELHTENAVSITVLEGR